MLTYDHETERIVRPVLLKFARYWESLGAGDLDDLAQEGRIALSKALQKYDGKRANLRTYAAGVLRRTYMNALRDRLRQVRTPLVWEQGDDGEWRQVPCLVTPVSHLLIEGPEVGHPKELVRSGSQPRGTSSSALRWAGPILGPREDAEDVEESASIRDQHSRAMEVVRENLTELERVVLDLYLQPTPSLIAVARNLTGKYSVEPRHVALYLGVPVSRILQAYRGIRSTVAALDLPLVETT